MVRGDHPSGSGEGVSWLGARAFALALRHDDNEMTLAMIRSSEVGRIDGNHHSVR